MATSDPQVHRASIAVLALHSHGNQALPAHMFLTKQTRGCATALACACVKERNVYHCRPHFHPCSVLCMPARATVRVTPP
eukprot:364695-Chlamydomonas_euryale.AAC.4